ncbi:hypothetical protein [Streptomyces sp. NPDC050507]|uniref:hypothetical protein n=1 Tax=Streptomyces sp. NPDC050507 TaxID=3365619 RepID=UPI0037A4ECA0
MARHDRANTTSTERGLLHSYWLLSGYGLRVSRALGCLAAAMLATIGLLMGFGLPQHEPKQEATGTVPPTGGTVTFKIDKDHPQYPTKDRLTGERFEKALNVTLDSVVFRSSGQDLTTSGTCIEMVSRVTEPILLGLAVLAVRNRVNADSSVSSIRSAVPSSLTLIVAIDWVQCRLTFSSVKWD